MTNRLKSQAIVALILATAACNESSTAAPLPPTSSRPLGTLIGTVSGDSFTATFVPASPGLTSPSGISPAIYGGPSTAHVFGTNTRFTTTPLGRTWTFSVAMENLLSYAIGSNYTGALPFDTGGVFIFFTTLPTVTSPVPCSGCKVSLTNAMGARNFTAPAQPYFWYHNRPTARQSPLGSDTTSDLSWTFKTASFIPPDTVHSFTFSLQVSAMWPPPNESTWQVSYDGTADSVPDTRAEPLWRKFSFLQSVGAESWSSAGLQLTARNARNSIYFSRRDSLGNMSAYMDVRASVDQGNIIVPAALFGFAEPLGGKTAVVAVTATRAEFAVIDNSTGVWSQLAGSGTTNVVGTNTYRLRKFAKDSVVLCVGGARALSMPYSSLPGTVTVLLPLSSLFGLQGTQARAIATYRLVNYTIGSDGGGCS